MKEGKDGGKDEGKDGGKGIRPWAVLLAFAAAVALFLMMLRMERALLDGYEKGTVYAAAAAIPEGLAITEETAGAWLVAREVEKGLIPGTALSDPAQAYGLAAAARIDAGTLLTLGMFEDVDGAARAMDRPVIVGLRAEDIYQVASGTLRPGDRIDICVVDEETREVVAAWQDVSVHQVFDLSGNEIPGWDAATPAQRLNILLEQDSIGPFWRALAAGSLRVARAVD